MRNAKAREMSFVNPQNFLSRRKKRLFRGRSVDALLAGGQGEEAGVPAPAREPGPTARNIELRGSIFFIEIRSFNDFSR